MKELNTIRSEIDAIDSELIELFMKRMDCSREVAEYKIANDIPVLNRAREDEILGSVEARGGEYGKYARELYKKIMELSRELQSEIINGQ